MSRVTVHKLLQIFIGVFVTMLMIYIGIRAHRVVACEMQPDSVIIMTPHGKDLCITSRGQVRP